MTIGLPLSRLINVQVVIAAAAAIAANNTLMIVGDSDVINTHERYRGYSDLAGVATDFGTTVPEYLAAQLFFGQSPQPAQLYIGRWAQGATHGLLVGGNLTPTQQLMATWTAIVDGAFHVTIDGGAPLSLTGLDFHLQTNLNGVASVITAGGLTGATCTWDGHKFTIKSTSTGAASTVSFVTAGAGGHVDIAPMLLMSALTASYAVAGIVAETALAAVTALDQVNIAWYGLTFASTHIVDADHLVIAAYVEAANNKHLYGVSTADAGAIDPVAVNDIGYELKQLDYNRTFTQYSSLNNYAAASFFGRALTVDFGEANAAITMMYKKEPGVGPELLSSNQANALDGKNYNYLAGFNNGESILVNGIMASGVFFDTMQGVDWLANDIQGEVYNLLIANNKIPQTDAGSALIATVIEAVCQQGVTNGLIGQGLTWRSTGFGILKTGQVLPTGYYIFSPPLSSQGAGDRAARKSVPFQVGITLSGAVHTVLITVNVNQ